MATYHCSVKHGSKGNGASSAAKADYICREGKYADKPDLEYKESGNMPEWAQASPRAFWHVGDQCERANGRVYTEIETALPREISPDQRRELVQNFIHEQLPGHPYTVAIHTPKATLDGGDQPHAHIIFSERKLDGIERNEEQFFKRANAKTPEKGGTAKARTWNEREKVQQIRESWEQHYNRHSPEQVSCRSLKEQGVDREPERHLGPKMARLDAPEAGKVMETREDLKKLEEIKREMATLSREITTQDIVVGEKPKKTRPTPTTERKDTKKQDISHTPEPTRPADPDELANRSRNTTSSEREKSKETARLDQAKQPPQVVTVKISELLNEARDYRSRTHSRDTALENGLNDLKDSLIRPYYKEAVEQYVTQKYKSEWDKLNETTKDYSERVTAYNETVENAGWLARNFKDFKTPALELEKERQEIINRQTELEENKASDKQKLLGSDYWYVPEKYEVDRLAEKLHQERDPQGYATKRAAIPIIEDRIKTERHASQPERDRVDKLCRNLGKLSNSDRNKYIELTFPVDQAGKRLALEQALSNPATREITGKAINSLNQSLELNHKERDRGIER
jgi:hypothetical protein